MGKKKIKERLYEIDFVLMATSIIIHYLYLIRGDYLFFLIATSLILVQMYIIITFLTNK